MKTVKTNKMKTMNT